MTVVQLAPPPALALTRAVLERSHVEAFIRAPQVTPNKSLIVKVIEINLYRIIYR